MKKKMHCNVLNERKFAHTKLLIQPFLALARVSADTGSFIRGAIDLGVSMEESSAVAAPTMVSGVDIDDSGSEACEGGV